MLNGVGGCTVAEAKERLTYAEALSWFAYIRKRGSLNLGTRLEAGFALQAAIQSGKQMTDFMPHADRDAELSVESVFKKLGGVK